jgi:hypothetical protein
MNTDKKRAVSFKTQIVNNRKRVQNFLEAEITEEAYCVDEEGDCVVGTTMAIALVEQAVNLLMAEAMAARRDPETAVAFTVETVLKAVKLRTSKILGAAVTIYSVADAMMGEAFKGGNPPDKTAGEEVLKEFLADLEQKMQEAGKKH